MDWGKWIIVLLLFILVLGNFGIIGEDSSNIGSSVGSIRSSLDDLVDKVPSESDVNRTARNEELKKKLDEDTFTDEDFAQESTASDIYNTNVDINTSSSEMNDLFRKTSDSYNNFITFTEHRIDVPSTYPFNSERLEYIENGAVTDFNSSDKTVDLPCRWQLNGTAGDKQTIRTRQRIRYVPGYEAEYGMAWFLDEEITEGTQVIVEHGNGDSGFSAVYNSTGSYYRIKKNGTVTNIKEFDNPVNFTQPQIDKGRVNMYGVGNSKLYKYYLNEDHSDSFEKVVQVGNLNDLSTKEFNLPLRVTLDCSDATSCPTLNVGSFQSKQRGSAQEIDREKKFTLFGLGGSIDDTSWTTILAIRKTSDKENIHVNLARISGIPTSTMKVNAFAVRDGRTDATQFQTPPGTNSENDVIEYTTNVSTPTNTSEGRQMNEVLLSADNKNKGALAAEETITPIYDDEVVVFMAKAKSVSNGAVDLSVETLQEW